MNKKDLEQKIITILSKNRNEISSAFSRLDEEIDILKDELRQNVEIDTLKRVNLKLQEFKKSIDLQPISNAISAIKFSIDQNTDDLTTTSKLALQLFHSSENSANEIKNIQRLLPSLVEKYNSLLKTISQLEIKITSNIDSSLKKSAEEATADRLQINSLLSESEKRSIKSILELSTELKKFSQEYTADLNNIRNRINNIGGGNANRNILVGGNPSTLSKYTDINLKAGSNVTITYSNNETLKTTDITISSSGGGGSSTAGVVRSINNVSTSQIMGSVAGTDYVYLATAGINLTLPPNVATNTNLYTIKNVSNSSVLVSGTIDNDANGIIMPVKYTSVDIISDTTSWNIT